MKCAEAWRLTRQHSFATTDALCDESVNARDRSCNRSRTGAAWVGRGALVCSLRHHRLPLACGGEDGVESSRGGSLGFHGVELQVDIVRRSAGTDQGEYLGQIAVVRSQLALLETTFPRATAKLSTD